MHLDSNVARGSKSAIRTLVLMHTDSNVGFAIAPLESAFCQIAMELGDDHPGSVHFAYRSLEKGYPSNLPPGIPVIEFNGADTLHEPERLLSYVRKHEISFVLAFDLQPVTALYAPLRQAGVQCIVSYWGAEISPRKPWWQRTLKALLLSVSRSRLDGLIFESEAMADLARYGRGVPNSMIDVVPLGIDVSRFSATPTAYVYEQFAIPRDKRIVVYAGHMEPRKGVKTLIEAAVELLATDGRKDVVFLLCGDRPGERDAFQSLYHGLGIERDIIFAGYRNDLHLCFPGCFAGTIPSSGWDSFPRTSLELAACGLPLVVSRLGGLPETIVEGQTGLIFPPGQSKDLASHLRKLLDDPALARRMGVNGRTRCESGFTLTTQHRRLAEAIRRRLTTVGL